MEKKSEEAPMKFLSKNETDSTHKNNTEYII